MAAVACVGGFPVRGAGRDRDANWEPARNAPRTAHATSPFSHGLALASTRPFWRALCIGQRRGGLAPVVAASERVFSQFQQSDLAIVSAEP